MRLVPHDGERGSDGHRTLSVHAGGGLVTITLARPDHANALDDVLVGELAEVTTGLSEDRSVRAVLLRGAGPTFCAGGDIELLASAPAEGLAELVARHVGRFQQTVERLAALEVPVVAAVRGAAAGGGLALVAAADLVVAADDAVFTAGYGGIGMSPDGGLTASLPRVIGLRRSQEMLLTGRLVSAGEALRWGLVTRIFPALRLEVEAVALARSLAQDPTGRHGRVRRQMHPSRGTRWHDHLDEEARTMVDVAGSVDAAEGIKAFRDRRRPRFTGT